MAHKETFTDSSGNVKSLDLRFHRQARMRYRAESIEQLFDNDYQLLKDILKHHQDKQRPRIQELIDYSEGNNHSVLESDRRGEDGMSDNRAVHNFGRAISSFKQGYLVGNPIKVVYGGADDQDYNNALERLALENDFDQLDRSIVLDLSVVGRAFDLVYRAMDDTTRAVKLDPLDTFVIFDQTLENHSVAGVRYYKKSQFKDDVNIVEVYTNSERIIFEQEKELIEISREKHFFEIVPITEYLNTASGMGDYESELSLIDLYDSSQSDTANYMQDLSDAILAIIGRIGFPSDVDTADKRIEYIRKMRKARFLNLEPPIDGEGREGHVDAKYLYKEYDVDGTEAYKSRIVNDIHKFTNTPDMTDLNFGSQQSGEALKWKIFGFDQERINMQNLFEKSLKRRYRLVAKISEILKEIDGFDVSKLKITFTPNLPADTKNVIDNAKNLYGMTSDQTVFEMLQLATGVNAQAEMERLKNIAESSEDEQDLGDVSKYGRT